MTGWQHRAELPEVDYFPITAQPEVFLFLYHSDVSMITLFLLIKEWHIYMLSKIMDFFPMYFFLSLGWHAQGYIFRSFNMHLLHNKVHIDYL